jgi:hypothetical protein
MARRPLELRLHPALAIVLVAALPAGPAGAEALVTDRPDFVESSRTVAPGEFQIETSFAQETNRRVAGTKEVTSSTPTLLRYGIAKNWELRVETDGAARRRTQSEGSTRRSSGVFDSSVGVKWHSLDPEGARPSMGWLAHADLPTGTGEFKGRGVRPSLRAVFEWELPGEMSLGVMPGVISDTTAGNRRFTAGILGVVLGKSWTESFRTFVEAAGQQLASTRNGGSVVTWDVGGAWLVNDRVQLDAAYYGGANKNTPNGAWTVGLSVKF